MGKEMKEVKMAYLGTLVMDLFTVSYEDKKQPSEKGLGYVTNVAAPNEELAREFFANDYEDCEILEITATGDDVVVPVFGAKVGMTLNSYQAKAMTTCLASSANFPYMMLNLFGEVGEFSSKMAKAIRKKQVQIGGSVDTEGAVLANELCDCSDPDGRMYPEELGEALQLEAGDILWQLAGLCDVMGWRLEDVAQKNLDKLSARKEAGTIDGNGDGVNAADGRSAE